MKTKIMTKQTQLAFFAILGRVWYRLNVINLQNRYKVDSAKNTFMTKRTQFVGIAWRCLTYKDFCDVGSPHPFAIAGLGQVGGTSGII